MDRAVKREGREVTLLRASDRWFRPTHRSDPDEAGRRIESRVKAGRYAELSIRLD